MRPTEPTGLPGRRVVFAENQPEYQPMPASVDVEGVVRTRWSLDEVERRAILDGACVELAVWTFNQPPQPVYLRVQGVEEPVEGD